MKRLIEITDQKAREDMSDYYIISKSRLDNILWCFKQNSERVKNLIEVCEIQQEQLRRYMNDKNDN